MYLSACIYGHVQKAGINYREIKQYAGFTKQKIPDILIDMNRFDLKNTE